ncbi:MAG: trxA, partial [Oscillospiraceae bacterium]|nr:trxA [Oscillospiraceae bacterium]
FGAKRCGVCQIKLPVIKEIAKELHSSARFYEVEVDENEELVARCRLQGIPALLLYKNGAMITRVDCMKSKSELIEAITKWI